MKKTRHEEYAHMNSALPFHFNSNLERTKFYNSEEMNWHENLEIQFCNTGSGTVLLDGEEYTIIKNDIIVVNSNVIHYTSTDKELNYSALIISSEFCKEMCIDYDNIQFSPIIKDINITELFLKLQGLNSQPFDKLSIAKQTAVLLELLIRLTENYSTVKICTSTKSKSFERVKSAIKFIKNNYSSKILLDDIAKSIYVDKYLLAHDFKKITGQTIIEYINNYRCQQASNLIISGYTVNEAATKCGFENSSYFTKTFKKYIGILPSKLNKNAD